MLAHKLEEVERRHSSAAQEKGLLGRCVLDLNPLGFLKNTPPPSRSSLELAEEGWGPATSLQSGAHGRLGERKAGTPGHVR